MATPQLAVAFNDFSLGEVDATIKRSEGPAALTGGRQMANFRILNTHKLANRPGCSPLFFESARVEEILMAPGQNFYLAFGQGFLRVYNAAGTRVFSSTLKGDGSTAIPWSGVKSDGITWAIINYAIYIFYAVGAPNNVPQILTWDGTGQGGAWTLTTFAETITAGSQKRTPFYRIAPPSITLSPSALTGSIQLTFSSPVLTSGMIGTRLRWCNCQMTITAVTLNDFTTPTAGPSLYGTATVNEALAPASNVTFGSDPRGALFPGDLVVGSVTGAEGIVTNLNSTTATLQLLGLGLGGFSATDKIVGPHGSIAATGVSTVTTAGQAVALWDQEVMNSFQGWPSSVTYDQTRLILCNFPSVPSAIAWSAIALPTDLYVGANSALPNNAIFELAPDKCQVLFVVGGMEGSEFFFCDTAIYYTPINVNNPLKPGSVAFNELSAWGCAPNVQPRSAEQSIVYMKAGGVQVGAVQVPGAYYRPYVVDSISEFHSHLFIASPAVSIALPSAATQFEELYIYITLANGSLVVGKYTMHNGLIEPGQDGKPKVGWTPWSGTGATLWCAALGGDVIFTTNYQIAGAPSFTAVEKSDATQYLDCAVKVNALPAALAPPGGKGPLWFIAGGSAFLIDNGTRFMGTYQVDPNGWIIPQNQGGENLNSANLIAGQTWTATYEPFVPHAPSGESHHQRMKRRRVTRAVASVQNSSGFVLDTRRIPAYFEGDDATQPAPLREDSYRTRPRGWVFDPRVALVKDTPGPLTLLELGLEATV